MNKKDILKDLSDFIAIPSISADPAYRDHMKDAVSFLTHKLRAQGFTIEMLQHGDAPATIIASLKMPGAEKTIGIYGHYDVQPEDPVDEWETEPFTLTQRNGKLYGRGVADNKGHIIQNIAAIEDIVAKQGPKNNIIFILEGEEESGSENFERYIKEKKEQLSACDVFFVTDVEMYKKNIPMIIYALRGLVYFEIEVVIGEHDLHSGVYGNAVLNPAQVLSDLFTRMKDIRTGEVLIPGFYDDVRRLDEQEMQLLRDQAMTDDEFRKDAGTYGLTSLRGVPSYLAPKLFPSLDVHGFDAGFTGEGPKTVIPRKARAKFSCRLVEHQDVRKMEQLITDYIIRMLPPGAHHILKTYSYDNPFYTSLDDPYIQKTAQMLTDHFGQQTVFMREGGSVPAAEIIQRVLKKPVILTGFILPNSNLHAPNENFDEEMFFEGIAALRTIFQKL